MDESTDLVNMFVTLKLCTKCGGKKHPRTFSDFRLNHSKTWFGLSVFHFTGLIFKEYMFNRLYDFQDGDEEAVNYAALNYSTRKVKKVKQKQELPQECVYSAVRANHTQHHAPV